MGPSEVYAGMVGLQAHSNTTHPATLLKYLDTRHQDLFPLRKRPAHMHHALRVERNV